MEKELPSKDLCWNTGDPPRIGLAGTIGGFGIDRYPVTVCLVSDNRKSICVHYNDYVSVGPSPFKSESQEYKYYEFPDRFDPVQRIEFTLRKNGRWVRKGEDMNKGSTLWLGFRERWYNPSY